MKRESTFSLVMVGTRFLLVTLSGSTATTTVSACTLPMPTWTMSSSTLSKFDALAASSISGVLRMRDRDRE
jgi:hypothetical protein